ncbi:MAG: hypothetical protein OXC41_01825 [Gammaproteobacteria bacterium]|nr:hypothetical protein [Gammaproteobacteria bacterium]
MPLFPDKGQFTIDPGENGQHCGKPVPVQRFTADNTCGSCRAHLPGKSGWTVPVMNDYGTWPRQYWERLCKDCGYKYVRLYHAGYRNIRVTRTRQLYNFVTGKGILLAPVNDLMLRMLRRAYRPLAELRNAMPK